MKKEERRMKNEVRKIEQEERSKKLSYRFNIKE